MIGLKFSLADPDAANRWRKKRGSQELSLEDVAGCGMTFNTVDIETANSDRSTICQIGIAHVVDGRIVDRWDTLVDPEAYFDKFNIGIHKITPEQVRGAPPLPEVREELRRRLRGKVLVSHTMFDRSAFQMAMDKYDLEQLQVYWLDSARVVRQAWPDKFGQRGYGLKNMAHYIGYEFKHHDAREDAAAAAEIVLVACREHNVDIEYWLRRFGEPEKRRRSKYREPPILREPDPDGELMGEVLVFTGELGMSRAMATNYAACMGCNVKSSVTRKTTILVCGRQISPFIKSASGKSTKQIKAEELVLKGHDIEIISETDFLSLVVNHQPPIPL